jgi:hypothetical protein
MNISYNDFYKYKIYHHLKFMECISIIKLFLVLIVEIIFLNYT